jgi:hypothetical protein
MGVRDSVINAMQQTPPRVAQVTQAVPAYPAYPAPVMVYQPLYPPPPPPAAFYYRGGPHGRVGWGVSVWP